MSRGQSPDGVTGSRGVNSSPAGRARDHQRGGLNEQTASVKSVLFAACYRVSGLLHQHLNPEDPCDLRLTICRPPTHLPASSKPGCQRPGGEGYMLPFQENH